MKTTNIPLLTSLTVLLLTAALSIPAHANMREYTVVISELEPEKDLRVLNPLFKKEFLAIGLKAKKMKNGWHEVTFTSPVDSITRREVQETVIDTKLRVWKVKRKTTKTPKPKAETLKFPKHWGDPPKIQTRDYRKLPGDYGFGSSTLFDWIKRNMESDSKKINLPDQWPDGTWHLLLLKQHGKKIDRA